MTRPSFELPAALDQLVGKIPDDIIGQQHAFCAPLVDIGQGQGLHHPQAHLFKDIDGLWRRGPLHVQQAGDARAQRINASQPGGLDLQPIVAGEVALHGQR